jgi:23S rRNA C2498 (ribose-2'-O)-methylase RlmM
VNVEEIVSGQDTHHTIEINVICDHFTKPLRGTIRDSGPEKLIPKTLVIKIGHPCEPHSHLLIFVNLRISYDGNTENHALFSSN